MSADRQSSSHAVIKSADALKARIAERVRQIMAADPMLTTGEALLQAAAELGINIPRRAD